MIKDYVTAKERVTLSKNEINYIRDGMIRAEEMRLADLNKRLASLNYQSINMHGNAEKIRKNIRMLSSGIFRITS